MIMYPQHRKLQITKPEATSEPASRGSYLWRCPGGHDCHLPTFPLSGPKHGTWQPAINVATECHKSGRSVRSQEKRQRTIGSWRIWSQKLKWLSTDMDLSEMRWNSWSPRVMYHFDIWERSPKTFLPISCSFQDPVSHLLHPVRNFLSRKQTII